MLTYYLPGLAYSERNGNTKIPYGESAQGKLGRLPGARKQPNKPVQQAPFDRLVRRGSREAQVVADLALVLMDA